MLKKIIDIISRELSINPDKIRSDSTIENDLNADRADLLTIVTDLEDEYDIIIDYSKLDTFQTVDDLNNYVAEKL